MYLKILNSINVRFDYFYFVRLFADYQLKNVADILGKNEHVINLVEIIISIENAISMVMVNYVL